jgi:hypothetical protein
MAQPNSKQMQTDPRIAAIKIRVANSPLDKLLKSLKNASNPVHNR